MEYVSVIIPTFNRFKYVLNTIESVKSQTYKHIEIIVVNDCSTEKDYYEYNWKENGVTIIHLEKNTKELFGFPCAGYVRNKGIEIAMGTYIAFCDDDDIWLPNKIDLQLHAMKKHGCKMSSTDGLIGNGPYDTSKSYKKHLSEHYIECIHNCYKYMGLNISEKGFPEIWNLAFSRVMNCIVCSSVLIEKELLNKINNMKCVRNGEEDYSCWLQALEHTNSAYVEDICFYYDAGHGYGRNY